MQGARQGGSRIFPNSVHLEPGWRRKYAVAHFVRGPGLGQFIGSGDRNKDLFKQFPEKMILLNGEQITKWRGIGYCNHAANLLARAAAGWRFKNARLAVQIGFSDGRQRNMVLAQEIFGCDPRKAEHLRDLKKG